MHRAIGRVFRGTVRKWRENEVPTVAGEEVRKKQENRKGKFAPPTHTLNEAIGWTAGLVISYEIAHRRGRNFCGGVTAPGTAKRCPFNITEAVTQPLYGTFSTAGHVNPKPNSQRSSSASKATSLPVSSKRSSSIDATPFLHEPLLDSDFRLSDVTDSEDEVSFGSLTSLPNKVKDPAPVTLVKPKDPSLAKKAENLAGHALSLLGAIDLMRTSDKTNHSRSAEPPLSALDLLEKGSQYGSGRALYNFGVFYDRSKETGLAREYYKRASDLGHPLATYNYGIILLQDGEIKEGLKLMEFCAEHGVPEASAVMRDLAASP